jgi:hypothetical protein
MNSWASVAPELVAFGTKAASGWKYFDFISEGIVNDPELKIRKGLRGPSVRQTYLGPKRIGGPITMDMLCEGMGYFLRHGMGGYAYQNDAPVTGARTHTFTLADALPNYGLSMEVLRSNIPSGKPFVYTGGKVNSLKLACSTGEPLTLEAGMVFQNELVNQDPSASPTYPTDYPVLWRHSGALTLCGESDVPFDSIEFTLSNTLPTDRFLMKDTLRNPFRNDLRMIEGESVGEYNDLILYAKFLTHQVGALAITFTTDSLITGTTYRSIAIASAGIRLKGTTPTIDGPGVMPYRLPFIGVYNSAEPLTITMVSTETTLS